MRRFKHWVLGGIENKIFNLILITVILLMAASSVVSLHHSNMLVKLAGESSARQQESIGLITGETMDTVVEQSMGRTTELEAMLADDLFHDLKIRVEMLGDYAGKLFANPDAYPRTAFAAPDPARNGEVLAQLILAEGLDPGEEALSDRLGLAANMSDLMVSLFGLSPLTNSCFIALPEGAFLVTDDRSATKFDGAGQPVPYDPRTRPWYIQAVEAGGLIFTDVEVDAFTGDIGIVCAMPVYVDGELAAVVGSDLFLSAMQEAIEASDEQGGYLCVVNQNGHVVFSPKKSGPFQVLPAAEAVDLRQAENGDLAALIADALKAQTDVRRMSLEGADCFVTGAPLESVGWTLISVFGRDVAMQPVERLNAEYQSIQAQTTATYRYQTGKSRSTAIVLLVGATLLMLAFAVIVGKRIVKPLNTITRRISELREGDLEFRMEDAYRTGDEVEELAQAFAALSHKTVQYVDEVKRVTAEKERIGAELSLATNIQAAMLPHIVPAFPDRTDFDIFATMDPAKEVGGDFYDYFLIDDDHLCMVMADVSGKGVPAALFMMASKIILQSVAMLGASPAEVLAKTNEAICSNNEAQMFVTVWLGILELSTGKLTAANAGHEYPVLKRAGGPFELFKDKHGFVIGGLEGAKYREYELNLVPGDKLFVYTDGVPEATDADNALFGTERMLEALNEGAHEAPQQILRTVRRRVDAFVGEAEQFDDLTMLCLEYKGPAKS